MTDINAQESWTGARPMSVERQQARIDTAVVVFFKVQIVSCICLQKIGIPIGGVPISLPLPVILLSMAVMACLVPIYIDRLRLLSFVVMALLLFISQLGVPTFAVTAIMLFLGVYCIFMFKFRISAKAYMACMDFFVNAMLVICVVLLGQHVIQFTLGASYWPNIETIVPESMLTPSYNYLQRIFYGSSLYKPNAIFFLEVSIVSQYLALAMVVELVFRRRMWVVMALSVALISTFAGTGLVVIGLTLPLVFWIFPQRFVFAGLAIGVVVLIVGTSTGLIEYLTNRLAEFSTEGTSGYYRYTLPFQIFFDLMADPHFLWSGYGAGAAPAAEYLLLLTGIKLVYEYGLFVAIAYYALCAFGMFVGSPSKMVAWAFLMCINFGGGSLVTPAVVVLLVTMCCVLRLLPGEKIDLTKERERDRRPKLPPLQGQV